jgi:hypothetical protein
MLKIRKTFKTHTRELVAVILLQLAAKIAPKHIKPLCRMKEYRKIYVLGQQT